MPRHCFDYNPAHDTCYELRYKFSFIFSLRLNSVDTYHLVPFGSQTLKGPSIPADIMARAVVADNLKMSDMPPFNRGDGKIDFPPWRMQVKRMLSASNISVDRQSAFILGALTGESLGEILAYFGPNGPPDDIAPADL